MLGEPLLVLHLCVLNLHLFMRRDARQSTELGALIPALPLTGCGLWDAGQVSYPLWAYSAICKMTELDKKNFLTVLQEELSKFPLTVQSFVLGKSPGQQGSRNDFQKRKCGKYGFKVLI